MPTYKIRKVKRKDIARVGKYVTWKKSVDIFSQFVWCANGGDSELTQCVVLVDEMNNVYVGFLGFTLNIEDLQSNINAYVAVEFVYLHTPFRDRGLSNYFIECIIGQVTSWLRQQTQAWSGRVVTLYSASNPKSDAGLLFVKRLDKRLRAVANLREYLFTSSIDNDD